VLRGPKAIRDKVREQKIGEDVECVQNLIGGELERNIIILRRGGHRQSDPHGRKPASSLDISHSKQADLP